MTADEILVAAANEEEPEGLDMAQRLLWCRMRESYRAFRAGEISREAGGEAKKKAMAEYRENANKLEQGRSAHMRMARLWLTMEQAANAFRKEPSLETADRVMEAVYGLL